MIDSSTKLHEINKETNKGKMSHHPGHSHSKSNDQLSKEITKILKTKSSEIPLQNRALDFLSAAGKIATIILAITPLPTFLGVWGKPKKEQIQRVESISF